jgi:hypothetical protein
MAAQSIIIPLFGRQKPYAARLAQTSDHLPIPWAAGDPHLFHGSRVRRRRGRQLDRAGFQGAYLLDLHNVARHPHRFKFNWRRFISEVRRAAHSFLVNGAFRHSARRRLFFYGKLLRAQAISSRQRTLMEKSRKRWCYFPHVICEERWGRAGKTFLYPGRHIRSRS